MKRKTICIDFDGVIAQYQAWEGKEKFGAPVPGVQSALKVLKKEGYKIIIFTTREVSDGLKTYLKENDIVYDHINENPDQPKDTNAGKPIADLYVDDRSVCFRGNWKHTLEDIAYFKPWQETKEEEEKDMQKTFERYRQYAKKQNECIGRSIG
jgi:adenylylsulfate kinase